MRRIEVESGLPLTLVLQVPNEDIEVGLLLGQSGVTLYCLAYFRQHAAQEYIFIIVLFG